MAVEVSKFTTIGKQHFNEQVKELPLLSDSEISGVKSRGKASFSQGDNLTNSTIHQINRYGYESWTSNYEFLRTAQPEGRVLGDKAKNTLWKSLPVYFRVFQEIFADPHQRIIPVPADKSNPSLRGCIIAPHLIPRKLAHAMGLIDMNLFKGKAIEESLKHLLQEKPLNMLRLIFQSSKRVCNHNSRIFIIERPDSITSLTVDPDYKMPRKLPGSLLYTTKRNESSDDKQAHKKSLKVSLYSNAYGAIRRTEHIQNSYATEIDHLSEIKAELQIFIKRLDRSWRIGATRQEKDDLLQDWAVVLQKSLTHLNDKKIDKSKLDAFEALSILDSFKDKRGKENVSAAMTKMVKAIDRIAKRLTHTKYIGGYNTEDQMMLRAELRGQEIAILNFCRTIKDKSHLAHEKVALFKPHSHMSIAQLDVNQKGFMRALRADPDDIVNVRMRPLRNIARLLTIKYNELKSAVYGRNLAETRLILSHISRIGEFAEELISIERAKLDNINR